MSQVLISDRSLPIDLACRYMSHGYQPVIVHRNAEWVAKNGLTRPINQHEGFFSEEQMLEEFKNHPYSGIGVLGDHFRDGTTGLMIIDVDIEDQLDGGATMQVLADIIGTPAPVKYGSKGGTFFVRYHYPDRITDIMAERRLAGPSFIKATKFYIPHIPFEKPTKPPCIEIFGAGGGMGYTVVPPSKHQKPNDDGTDRFYRWIPFPGTDIVQDLSEVPPSNLPALKPYHLLLIYQYAKNPTSPIFRYIGQTSPGDHHHSMLSATTYMYHEKFTEDEIEEICAQEAERSAPDDTTLKERLQEIKIAVKALANKIKEQKPAKQSGKSGGSSALKVPLDRIMYNWLRERYKREDLGYFSGVAYHWDEGSWHIIKELGADNPWHIISNKLIDTFDIAGQAAISASVKMFRDSISPRVASPDPYLIAFANGVLDTRDFSMRPEERDDNIVTRIEHGFDPSTKSTVWQQFLKNLLRPPAEYEDSPNYETDWRKAYCVVEEFLGYCLVRSHQFEKMLFLIGRPGTGKSTLFKVINAILPRGFVSNVGMDQFDDPNSMIDMATANLNVASEVDSRNKNIDRMLQNVCSGEFVKLKVLYEDAKNVILPTRLLFHGNNTPDTYDSTGAIERRSLIIRTTDVTVAGTKDQVMNYDSLLAEEAPGILAALAKAYRRLMERGHFDPPDYSMEAAKSMTVEANSVSRWLSECCEIVENIADGTTNNDLYSHYSEWATMNGFRPVFNSSTWGKRLTGMGLPTRSRKLPGNKVVNFKAIKLITNINTGARY